MSRSLGQLTLDLIAKTGGFEQGMDKAARVSAQRSQQIEKQWQNVSRTFRRLGVLLAGAFSVEIVRRNITQFINEADRMSKAAQAIGVTTEALSALEFAAEMSGTGADKMGAALRRLSGEIEKTSRDTGEGAKAFRALQIEVVNAQGELRDTEDVLMDLADRFSRMEDGTRKTALAMQIFGQSGAQLIPFLNAGRDGIEDLRKEAEKLGRVISTETGKAAEEFNDNLARLRMQSERLWRDIATEALPALIDLTNALIGVRNEAGATGSAIATSFRAAIDAITETVRFVQWAAEEFAVFRFGIAQDDIARLSQEADRIRDILDSSLISRRGQQLRFFGKDGIVKWYSEDELRGELERIESQIESIMANTPRSVLDRPESRLTPFTPVIEGAKEAEKAVKSLREEVDKIGPMLAALAREVETFGMARADVVAYDLALLGATDSQIQFGRAMVEMLEALQEQQSLMEEGARLYEQMRTPAEQLSDEINRLNTLLDAGAISWDTYARAIFAAQERFDAMRETSVQAQEEMSEFAIQAARSMQSAFADFLFNPFESSTRDMVRNFALAINRMVAEVLAAKILQSFFSSVLGMPNVGALFGGARAMGGPVSPGKAYLVGEQGPELFSPHGSGSIVPNNQLGRSETRIVNVLDPGLMEDYLYAPGGEQAIVNVIRRNAGSVREVLA